MASVLSAAPQGRISQLLPTVKCSNCNRPVPLNDLSDHVCSVPPPVPSLPLPKPSLSPAAATSLLPQHLQDRLASPVSPRQPELPQQRPSIDALRINTSSPSLSKFQSRPSPLASRTDVERTSSPFMRSNLTPSPAPSTRSIPTSPLQPRAAPSVDIRARRPSNAGSMHSTLNTPSSGPSVEVRPRKPSNASSVYSTLNPPPSGPSVDGRPRKPSNASSVYSTLNPPPSGPSVDGRPRKPSNASSIYSTLNPPSSSPSTARPAVAGPSAYNPPPLLREPQRPPLVPNRGVSPTSHPYPEPDTKIGGEAGMAGVGRRGFAAAARAAMFVMPSAAPVLNTDIPRRTSDTPPLSSGSGNSSHSPGVSPYPQSPVSHQMPPYPEVKRTPPSHKTGPSVDRGGLPPSPNLRKNMPLSDQNRSQALGLVIPNTTTPDRVNVSNVINSREDLETPSTAKQPPPRPSTSGTTRESESTFSLYSQGVTSRSASNSSRASRPRPTGIIRAPSRTSTTSGSEYGGLAYANSTDHEDEEEVPLDSKTNKGKANPPPPLPLTSGGILRRSGSTSSMANHVRFPSSTHLPRNDRKGSVSSVSSAGDELRKSNSAAIAQALGLSQAPTNSYSRLGGPGSAMGGRGGRSRANSAASASSGSRSAHSRSGGTSGSSAVMEKELKMLLEDNIKRRKEEGEREWEGIELGMTESSEQRKREEKDLRTGLSKSKSTISNSSSGKQRSVGGGSSVRAPLSAKNPALEKDEWGENEEAKGLYPESAAGSSKAPTRSKSSSENTRDKDRVKRTKICLKCSKKIEDGRWVATENGGVLCEKCWKHMYLPKCRRCNLPIENAAVSSSDGQLKGKYHRECFNCHQCHKPFPDKSFYVFDGKPLCAYHYHEANDSLCAAALCGQPIEGPCAVSHTGDKYHPEHMVCEYPGNLKCKTKLEEYWEIDGRMLCERHAHASKVGSDDEQGEEEWVMSSKKTKRVTRFIDLAGGLPSR